LLPQDAGVTAWIVGASALVLGIISVFALEYAARVWAAGEDPRYRGFAGRLRYMASFYALWVALMEEKSSERKRIFALILAGLAAGAAMLTHLAGCMYAGAGLFLLLKERRLLWVSIFGIAALFWVLIPVGLLGGALLLKFADQD
jgi:hypothetical protein